MNLEIRRALTFAILMQGIMSKSPDYILEKWSIAKELGDPEMLLDPANLALFKKWIVYWNRKKE